MLLFGSCFVSTGCRAYQPLNPPGTIDQQRSRAAIHDPFPDNDIGPEVEGGRPREFQKPLAEPVRNPYWRDASGLRF
jgi:hypothetical protein